MSSILLGSYNLSTSSCAEFLEPWGEGLLKTSHLKLGGPKSSTLCTWSSCTSLNWFPFTAGGKSLWWWPNGTLVYGNSRMSLGVFLLLCSFTKIRVYGFPVGPWSVQPQFLATWSCQIWIPSHGLGLKYSKVVVGYSHNVCATFPSGMSCIQKGIHFNHFI